MNHHTLISNTIRSVIMLLVNSVVLLCAMFYILPTDIVHAQSFEDIAIKVYPEFPTLGDRVTVTVNSTEVNLDFQRVQWYLDGQLVAGGQGITSYSFVIDQKKPSSTVRAVIGSSLSPIIRETIVSPGSIILLWEAVDSYVPFWYQGKALLPAEGMVRITAIPVGSVTLDRLFFLWKLGDQSLSGQSGIGRNSVVVRNNVLLDSVDISVQATSPDGSFRAQNSISIPRADSDIRIWSSELGRQPVYEQGGALRLRDSNASVQILPYGFSTRDGIRGVSYDWVLNDIPYSPVDGEPINQLFLNGASGSIRAQITVQGLRSLLQNTTVTKSILFQ